MESIKDNRIYVFIHVNEKEQSEFIKEAEKKDCFAKPIRFMVRQGAEDQITKKVYTNTGEEILPNDEKLMNGTRPYMTISDANPDNVCNYYNWSFLESVVESGWKYQFK